MSIVILRPGQPTPRNTQPGDILLVHGTAPLSRLINLGQRIRHKPDAAQWTHAACLDGTTLVEAEAKGILRCKVEKYDHQRRALIQLDITRHKRTRAAKYINTVEGMEYGFLDFASVAFSSLTGFGLIVTTSDGMICSQLVAEMLERCGLFVPGPPELVTPAALWDWAK